MDHIPHNTAIRLSKCATLLAKVSSDLVELASDLLIQSSKSDGSTARRQEEATSPSSSTSPRDQAKPASKAEVLASVKAAREVIGQENRPVHVSVLYREVNARGFVIRTLKPVLTYGSRLRDYKKRVGLIYLDGFGWWLVERPYPAANYTPESIIRIGKNIA